MAVAGDSSVRSQVVLLVGAPGSGKGTQAKTLVEMDPASFVHVSTGDLFRAEIRSQSELGKKVKEIIEEGSLVSDAVTASVLKSQLDHIKAEKDAPILLLDGYPRNGQQGQDLIQILSENEKAYFNETLILEFELADEALVERLSGRWINPRSGKIYHDRFNPPKVKGICDDDAEELIQRKDDQPGVLRDRLKIYHKAKKGLLEAFEGRATYLRVDADEPLEALAGRLRRLILEHRALLEQREKKPLASSSSS